MKLTAIHSTLTIHTYVKASIVFDTIELTSRHILLHKASKQCDNVRVYMTVVTRMGTIGNVGTVVTNLDGTVIEGESIHPCSSDVSRIRWKGWWSKERRVSGNKVT